MENINTAEQNEVSKTIEEVLAKYLYDYSKEDGFVLGYLNNVDNVKEILEKMKNLGYAFSVRDSDARQKQREKIKKISESGSNNDEEDKFSHLTIFYQLKAMPIKFFGLPFTIDKTTHYQCAYGCKYYKSRADINKIKINNLELKEIKRKKRVGSKKMGCLAKMTVKHITVYPEYKLDVESDWRKKKKLIENLRKDISSQKKLVEKYHRFYVSVSVQSSHNHPPIITKSKIKQKVNVFSKNTKNKSLKPDLTLGNTVVSSNVWNYTEKVNVEQEKCLNLRDDTFFHTLVKFPNTTTEVFEQVDYKPSEIEIEIKPYKSGENTSTIEVYEYQPTILDLQTLFKEKLKNLYTLCSNCTNESLILKLAGELEQVEIQLANEVNFNTI